MKKQFWIVFILAFVSVSCQQENFDTTEEIFPPDEEEFPGNESGEEGSLTLYRVNQDQISKIKDYPVSSQLKPYQEDYGKHQQMWELVVQLIPSNQRNNIAEFEVFHGGDELLGWVSPINDNDLSKWRFALAIDAATELESIDLRNLFVYVAIHEYAHVLTLNNKQVRVQAPSSCNTYYTGEGCSNAASYINAIYELGWQDIIEEADDDGYELYQKYPDRFVTDYAATNPAEDIAEVFTHFVIRENQPSGQSIADEKIRLMYTYPELVNLRANIRSNAEVPGFGFAAGAREIPSLGRFRVCGHRHKHN